jgi:hypothetical protein
LYLDDFRIAKADPDAASTFNDTGAAWDFSSGVWHVYADLSGIPYSLGQIEQGGQRSTAIKQGNHIATNYFSGGLYLRAAGQAGLLAFATDEDNAYEIKIDSDANTVTLIRWTAGNSYTLHTTSEPIDVDTAYLVGLERDGQYLRIYCKALTQTVDPLFSTTHAAPT